MPHGVKRMAEDFTKFKPGDIVVETLTHRKGMKGTVYISENELTKGSLCVMWEDSMGTSITHGTKLIEKCFYCGEPCPTLKDGCDGYLGDPDGYYND